MRLALLLAAACASSGALAACKSPPPRSFNTKPPEAGVAIALYASGDVSYGLVDDRRWIAIEGKRMLLANIDPGADLASLVIEPASSELRVGACVRERMPEPPKRDPLEAYAEQQRERRAAELRRRIDIASRPPTAPEPAPPPEVDAATFVPVVTCNVDAKPGRYLVRLLYVTSALGYRAQHDVDVRDVARVRVTSRFAVTTPVWKQRAELVLYDGVPGGEHAPREVARGSVELDGSTSVLAAPAREVQGRLRRVYEGAVVTSTDSTDPTWGTDSVQAVWVWLELAKLQLAPGPIRVHVELPGEGIRDLDVARQSRKQDDKPDGMLRLPLWVDESLRGSRLRVIEYNDGVTLTERFAFSVANTGETTREVFVEEPLRKASRRRLVRAWPKPPTPDGDTLRIELDVRPGRIERSGYTLTYDF